MSSDQYERLEIETEESIYEIEFAQVQIEITGRCNLRCLHCRAANQMPSDMPIEQIGKIARFATRYGSREIVLSGGEPLLHLDFPGVLEAVRASGMDYVSLTTNGYTMTKERLRQISDAGFKGVTVSFSLDSSDPLVHDMIRGKAGAFKRANDALSLVIGNANDCIVSAVRASITADQIENLDNLVEHVIGLGCRHIGLSAVQPVGRAIDRFDLLMTRSDKRRFLEKVSELAARHPGIDIGTNDPLQKLTCGNVCQTPHPDATRIYGGCGAAVTTFNVNSDGTMTPCAMFDIPMMNVFPLTEDEIANRYRDCGFVRDMLSLNLKGKCGECRHKLDCGGCRARAFAETGDYLAEDPHCWQ